MAKNRYVNTKFWDDKYICNLDPIEKLLFLYLLTNTLTNISGVYEIQLRRIAFDTGIDKDMVSKILLRFETDGKMFYEDGWIAIINFIKHQTLNPSIVEGIKKELRAIPSSLSTRLSTEWSRVSYLIQFNLMLENADSDTLSAKTSSLSFLDSLPEEKLEALRNQYQASKTDIQSKASDLADYCRAHGKTYKDYNAFLHKALRRDFGLRKPNSRTI